MRSSVFPHHFMLNIFAVCAHMSVMVQVYVHIHGAPTQASVCACMHACSKVSHQSCAGTVAGSRS